MKFILRNKQGIHQKKTQRIYINDCMYTDQIIQYIANKVSKKNQEFILRYKFEKINYRIIKGWSIQHFQLKEGSELQIQFLEQQQKQLKTKFQNKYLLNLLGDQKTALKEINQENSQQDESQNPKKAFDLRQYLDSQCEKLLKLVQKGKLNSCIKLLQQLPQNVDQQYIVQIQRNKPKIINQLGEGGWGAIHYAVFCNRIDIVNQLIKRNVDINKCTNDGWLPLQIAINKKKSDIVTILLNQKDININQLTPKGTALHIACKVEDLQTMEILLNRQADWKLVDQKGKNCFQVCQKQQCVKLLKKYQQKQKQKQFTTNLFGQDLVSLKGYLFKAKTIFLSLKQRFFVLNPFQGTLIQYENKQSYPKKPKQIIPLTCIKQIKFLKNQQKSWQMKKQYNYIDIYYPKRLLIVAKNYRIAQRWYNGINDGIKYQNYIQTHKLSNQNQLFEKEILTLDDKNNTIQSDNQTKVIKQTNNQKVNQKHIILLPKSSTTKKSTDSQSQQCSSPRMPQNPTQSISSRPSEHTSFGSEPSQRNPIIDAKSPNQQFSQIQIDMQAKVSRKQEYDRAAKQLSMELNSITNDKTNFSTFQILQTVGAGSFGKVFLARHIYSKKCYALKALKKKTLILKKQLKYAITQANILKQANHPFIINLHYAFQTPNYLYLALDYCPGKDLSFHLAREMQFSEADARFYIAQLLLAIEHLHQKNILYRDLKPQNVLLDAQGHIKLADFGLSKDNLEQGKSFCGTPAYLSPEMLNQKGVGKQSDLYGIGAVLYQFLEGEPPYYSDDIPTLYNNIRQGKLKFQKKISEQAKSLILGLLQRDPKKRLGTKGKDQIKSHPFFAGIDWKDVYEKRLPVPQRDYDENEQDSDDQIALLNARVNFKDHDYQESTKKMNRLNGFSFVRS